MFDQDDEYDDLLEKWRKRFFAPETIITQAADVGISLDFSDEEIGLTIRMSGGPTYAKQIRETWMTLGEDPLPATANLMDTDIGFTDEPTFSRRTLSNYAKLAIRKTEEYALKVNSVVERNS